VHAFFHLHWVHHSSRCSIPYTLRHFLVSPRSFLVGLPGNLLGADIDRSWLLLDWWCAWVPIRGLSFMCFWGELYKQKANVTCCDEVDKEHSLDNLIALTADLEYEVCIIPSMQMPRWATLTLASFLILFPWHINVWATYTLTYIKGVYYSGIMILIAFLLTLKNFPLIRGHLKVL